MSDEWGGVWTDLKLKVLKDYLDRFQTALKNQAYFNKIYIDAMAGEGIQTLPVEPHLLNAEESEASQSFRSGSAVVALKTIPQFDQYKLNERSSSKARTLRKSIQSLGINFAKVEISTDDANDFIRQTVRGMCRQDRGVVLLDPWGMQITWDTVCRIAETQHLDMWYLFPTQAVVRMLPRDGMPTDAWCNKLDSILGEKDWRDEFYKTVVTNDLFDRNRTETSRQVTFESVERYIVGRLRSTFKGSCVEQPLRIGRPTNPMFSFCFASGNPSEAAKRLTKTLSTAVISANSVRALK